jgi:hypothetical protein
MNSLQQVIYGMWMIACVFQDYKYRNLLAAVSLWAPKESNEP